MTSLALLGAGKIGEALLAGLLKADYEPGQVVFTEQNAARAQELTRTYSVEQQELATAVSRSDVVVIAVKPQDAETLLGQLAPLVSSEKLVVSMCAGLPISLFEQHLGSHVPVVRVMPNTPMLVGEAMSAITPGAAVTEKQLALVESMLASVGAVVRVPEHQQDAVTALSGSGPAYFFYLVEAMIEAGLQLGVSRPVATQLVTQAATGAAAMLQEEGAHAGVLREGVTSPAGTTAAALRELDAHAVRAAMADAIHAAHQRSVELGQR